MANTFSPIDNPHVLVLISRGPQLKIRVLNFLDEAKVQIVDAQTSNVSNDLGYYSTRDGSFVENYILHNMYNPILGITRSMFVVQGISVIEKADDGTHMQKEYLD